MAAASGLSGESAPLAPGASTPPLAGGATPPAACDELCCVCQDGLHPCASGGLRPVPFPVCSRHALHLECLARWRAHAGDASDLRCPLCRPACPACTPEGWTSAHDTALTRLCVENGVRIPGREPTFPTVRASVPDYTTRTFTQQDAPPPQEPIHVTVSCCPRVALLRGPEGTQFRELPDREARWSPIPHRHSGGIAAWTLAWACAACSRHIQWDEAAVPPEAGSACPSCQQPRRWLFDARASAGRLACHCEAAPTTPALTAALPTPPPVPGLAWARRGPPAGLVTTPTNSWCYVPLLHAATGTMAPATAALWEHEPRSAPWWATARQTLAEAPPVRPAQLLDALAASEAAEAAACHARLRAATAGLPAAACVHLGWALRHLLAPGHSGYAPAAAQEILLQVFGGLAFAANLDRLTDSFRLAGPPGTALGDQGPTAAALPAAPAAPPPVPPAETISDTEASASADEVPCPPEASSPPATLRPGSWRFLDDVDLAAEFERPVRTMQSVPRFLAPGLRHAFLISLRALAAPRATPQQQCRAWKLFLLTPRLLLRPTAASGPAGRELLLQRLAAFEAGRWERLLDDARGPAPARAAPPSPDALRARAVAQVRRGELSRARQLLTSSPQAPGTAATLAALSDPERRPPAPRSPVSQAVLDYQPQVPLPLSAHDLADALRTSKRGSAAGLSGATAEHYKVLLDDEDALELFARAATALANGAAPPEVLSALALARLTALAKPNGGVRGIATGDVLRRLVSRTLARLHAAVFDAATRPFQFALQTRAGTDCLASTLRVASELDPSAVIISLDGRSAYDCVSRSAFLDKLLQVAPRLVPFVRSFYAHTSTYLWWDDSGACHHIRQAEGCEQGDALAPALFSLGQHAALEASAAHLAPGDVLAAYLDDLYIVTQPARARAAFDLVTNNVERLAGVASNLGKTRVYSGAGGCAPPGIAELGPDVWRGDLPPAQRGFIALGSPIGSPEFVAETARDTHLSHAHLLQEIAALPDLQSAWLLLSFCAAPRAHHLLRTLPPAASATFAAAHDAATWGTLQSLLGEAGANTPAWQVARHVAFLPTQLGGLGLVAAERTAPAAYWAAWADALPVLRQRYPDAAARCVRELAVGDEAAAPCLRAAAAAATHLHRHGWTACPTWHALFHALQPDAASTDQSGPGLGPGGWQRQASLVLHQSFRESELLPALNPASRAMLRSQAGPQAAAWLTAIPSEPGTTLPPHYMHRALRRRLRLPLPLARARCGGDGAPGCGEPLDRLGDHCAACPRSGALARRAHVLEHAWVRVAREAVGAEGRVVPQQWLARTNTPHISPDDRRRLDLVVHGASPHGETWCCDATLVSALTRGGAPVPGAAEADGVALRLAERRKRRRYPELAAGGPQQLLVLACEVGGRWNTESLTFVRRLVRLRARRAPPAVRTAAAAGWRRRWWGLLGVAVQRALGPTLLGDDWRAPQCPTGSADLPLGEILALAGASAPSRLPLRP